ncbi:RNA-directed DNA polymerase from mobile element jockey [Trichonephila clavipes]|nr:RNA-directed DNA polymerase from mobile element jockey [Trichonephila clavipes]
MSAAPEVVTIQAGNFSNFIGTHWWNIQESSFCYNPDSSIPLDINHDVMFREELNGLFPLRGLTFFRVKIPNPPYPTHGGQPTNSQTCSESFTKFIVLHATSNRKLSNASPFLISKAVQGSAGSVKSIKKLPSRDLLIETQAQSINLLQCTNLSNIPITATPHKTLNSSKGVIYCPDLIPLPDFEIEEELASQGVEAVKRKTYIKDGKTVTSPLFIITFSKHTLPENILIGYLNVKIRPYFPNPLRCFRCQSYGHGTASCRGIATCNKCSSTEHATEACTTEWRKCANCKGEHAAYSKICPKWQQEKEIQRIKVLENISYSEAKKWVVNILPPQAPISYANAVMTNTKSKKDAATQTDIETQTEISNIETPTNIANLTSESHKDFPIAQKPITNNLIEQETILSPPETSTTDLESLNLDKQSPETSHLSMPSDTEVLMEIDKSYTKRLATDIVQEAAKILKPSI